MKFAKKMVLVPAEDLSLVVKAQAQDIPATVKKSVSLHDKMSTLVHGKRNKCKAYKYQKLLQDYLHYKKQKTSVPISNTLKSPIAPDSFLNYLPDIYKGKARLLLAHLEKHGVTWSDKGELRLSSGAIIEMSHGADLIREALVGSKKKSSGNVTGWNSFVQQLSESNVPKSLIGKKNTLAQLGKHTQKEDSEEPIAPQWLSL